jgi:cardiolipin synthase (CMP-forming)
VLGSRAFRFDPEPALTVLMVLVAALTLLSIALYLAHWVRHMNAADLGP